MHNVISEGIVTNLAIFTTIMNRDKFRRPSERELQEELAQEMEWAALHKKSVEGWMSIIRGIEAETEKGLDDESEWKTR